MLLDYLKNFAAEQNLSFLGLTNQQQQTQPTRHIVCPRIVNPHSVSSLNFTSQLLKVPFSLLLPDRLESCSAVALGQGVAWRVQTFPFSMTANSSLHCCTICRDLSCRCNAHPAEKERKSRAHSSWANGSSRKWEGPSLVDGLAHSHPHAVFSSHVVDLRSQSTTQLHL